MKSRAAFHFPWNFISIRASFFQGLKAIPMVTIRLTRRGSKKVPFYHVVVTDSRKRQGGRALEQIGFFNPIAAGRDRRLELDLGRVDYWVSKGAKPSERVAQLVATARKGQAAA